MQPVKNIITPAKPQANPLPGLILAERDHAAIWRAVLNEMRMEKELPEWVARQAVGTHAEHERYDAARQALNWATFGEAHLQPGDEPATLAADRQARIDLIEAERTHAIRWWTMLNSMRIRGQLPDWVSAMSVGTGPDMHNWLGKVSIVNVLLFGTYHARSMAHLNTAKAS